MKNIFGFKAHPIFLLGLLLLSCAIFLAGCIGDTASNAPSSNAQATPITPIGVLPTCLTVHPPSLVKLADGNYELVDEIENCGGNEAGPLKVTARIDTQSARQSVDLPGLAILPAHGKALYHTFTGQATGTNKELQFRSSSSPSASVTILVTVNGSEQGEWDGQVSIPR